VSTASYYKTDAVPTGTAQPSYVGPVKADPANNFGLSRTASNQTSAASTGATEL